MIMIVAASILSADFSRLGEEIEFINQSKADWTHVDIMDGVFVPNISFGFPVIESVKHLCSKPLDVHLMVVEPGKFIQQVKSLGTETMCVHYEACTHLHRTIQQIKENGMKAAVALNPHTPVSLLEEIICDLDMVLLMSVNPGFGGQKFIPSTLDKIKKLKKLISEHGCNTLIEIDGGVNHDTALLLKEAGADVLVAGNFVFRANDPAQSVQFLKEL
ncbi:MAG: ribulose-phosphate 3-epimerase [Bacteroidales bacterium]|nr:ribulose-phosphate 3-epimerase [Bacteroidales bacterium]MDD4822541.1 ribulose-phosphate 3-epimerase [Bacteroidales bacterium]